MASGTQIVFEFADANDNPVFFVFPYGDDDASTANINAAANAFITYGDIFTNPPVTFKKAKSIITSSYDFNLS